MDLSLTLTASTAQGANVKSTSPTGLVSSTSSTPEQPPNLVAVTSVPVGGAAVIQLVDEHRSQQLQGSHASQHTAVSTDLTFTVWYNPELFAAESIDELLDQLAYVLEQSLVSLQHDQQCAKHA